MIRRIGASADVRVDVRVIAATNVDLAEAVRRRSFREDLYYRLAVLELPLSALRERRGDVAILARHFIDVLGRELHKPVKAVTPAAWEVLASHDWPGNVRELRNVIERTLLLVDGDVVDAPDVQMVATRRRSPDLFRLPQDGVDLAALERGLVLQAIERAHGNFTEAGRMLGLHRDQIRYRLGKYGMLGDRPRPGTGRGGREHDPS
jgi:DNA-binding NtrC family response regulator